MSQRGYIAPQRPRLAPLQRHREKVAELVSQSCDLWCSAPHPPQLGEAALAHGAATASVWQPQELLWQQLVFWAGATRVVSNETCNKGTDCPCQAGPEEEAVHRHHHTKALQFSWSTAPCTLWHWVTGQPDGRNKLSSCLWERQAILSHHQGTCSGSTLLGWFCWLDFHTEGQHV